MEVIPPKRSAFSRQPAAFFHHFDDLGGRIRSKHPAHIPRIAIVHDSMNDIKAMSPKIEGLLIRVPKQPLNSLRNQIVPLAFPESLWFLILIFSQQKGRVNSSGPEATPR